LIVSAEQNLTLVDSKTLSTIDTIIGFNDEIIDIKYSKSGKKSEHKSGFVVVITNSNNAKIFNRHTMKLVSFVTGHEDTILCAEYFHPYLLTAGKDKVIKLHEIDPLGRSKLVANYKGHSEYISGLAVLIDRKLIVSASEDKTLKLWPLVQSK
jgi:WD40 repeat protein